MAREMKDSAIEWIGEIPCEWHLEKHKYLFSCGKEIVGEASASTQLLSLTTQGVKLKSRDAVGGKLPESFDTYQTVEKGNLIMCLFDLDCSAVFSGLSSFSGMVSPAYKVLKCSEKIIPAFADYWFRFVFDGRKFKSYAKNLRYTLNYDEFACIPMALPNLQEQHRIAAFLDRKCAEIDSVIASTQRTIEEYKALKQSIITEAVTKGVRGKRPIKDSGIEWIGEIPVTWNLIKITRILDDCHPYAIGDGDHGLISPSDYVDEGVPYIRVQNLGWGTEITTSGLVYITEETNKKIEGSTLRPGDVLFAKTGATIGKTGIVPPDMSVANTTSHVGKITVAKSIHPKFIMYVLASTIGYKQFWDIALQKTTRPELAISEIRAMKVLLPPDFEEQEEIASYLDKKCAEMDRLIEAKQQLLAELESYKKSVIYEYVTGKKEVPACQ